MKKKGFTLVELIVVVGIIGLLSSLAVISLGRQQARSRDTRRVGDITNINNALQSYVAEKFEPPLSTNDYSGWDVSSKPTTGASATDFMTSLSGSGYMQRVPVDPVNNATANYWWTNAKNGFTYAYYWAAGLNDGTNYLYYLGANLELTDNPAITDTGGAFFTHQVVLKRVPVRPIN